MTVRVRLLRTTTVVLMLGGIAVLLPLLAKSTEPREVFVVARQMSFFVGQGLTANPTIQVVPGERIRITLVSADPGFDHDFTVKAWGVKAPVLRGKGRTSIVFQAPDTPGTATYVCSFHSSMMSGTIAVVTLRADAIPRP